MFPMENDHGFLSQFDSAVCRYFNTLAISMTNNLKEIYASAAEVVGLVLSYLADKEKETEGQFHTYIESCLGKIKPDNFIVCVHHMHRHYAPIADRWGWKRAGICET